MHWKDGLSYTLRRNYTSKIEKIQVFLKRFGRMEMKKLTYRLVRHEVQQIQKDFSCDQLEAINILLGLITQEESKIYFFEGDFEEDLETLPKAA